MNANQGKRCYLSKRWHLCFSVFWLLSVLALAWAGEPPPASASDTQKATVIYNLSKFVRWPGSSFAGSDAPLNFCALGQTPFGGVLTKTLDGKESQRRTVRVAEVALIEEAVKNCHLLYLSPNETGEIPALLAALRGLPLLSVSDAEGFVQQGGIVGLSSTDDRVRFEINLDVARQNGMDISASLLGLARHVHYTASP